MAQVSTIGLDFAKNVFQVHGTDEIGEVVVHLHITSTTASRAPCTP